MALTFILAPGAKNANTNISVHAWVPPIRQLLGAIQHKADSNINLTVVTGTPSTNEIQLVNESTVQLGNAIAATDIIILFVALKGEYSGA